jgi:hypothetical protein
LLLIGIDRSIGCSLTIHRVESALLTETAFMADRAVNNNFLIASNMNFNFDSIRFLKTA